MATTSLAQPALAPLIVDYFLAGNTLIIASATTPGRLYVATATDCSCPTGIQEWPCKHAALRLNLLRPMAHTALVLTLDQADDL